ncbi:MAG: FAD-dependent oxidoreductase [Robiginitomaculum sp.]|nr:FAD-dependent oxidoreductase [Robiginitomaculum sp.]
MSFEGIPIYKPKPYKKAPELSGVAGSRHPFVIVGSGPIGLALGLAMARKGHQVTILAAFDFISAGSKGICYSKEALDIFDQLGIGERIVKKGVVWNVGKVFWGDSSDPVYQFDMLPVKDQKNPGFVNIQQYYVEDYLVDALEQMDNVDIRWGHAVSDMTHDENGATLTVTSRDGDYRLETDYVLACDGSKSTIRELMGLDFEGRIFEDSFLIADVKFKQSRPSERWFWFDPPFNKGRTALLHKQPDDIWRLDFQLGWDVDREEAIKSENVAPFIKGLLGEDIEYEEDWMSIYTFQCRRMARFVHGRVIFAGDAAHQVSPFGARGANSGLPDTQNLAWKLDMILRKQAPESLLESYNIERTQGADENILNSTRSTDFITPKSEVSTAFRDAALELANTYEFARPLVNSGRLSTPTPYHDSPLSTPDSGEFPVGPKPGHVCVDAPITVNGKDGWLLESLGDEFTLLHFGDKPPSTGLTTLTIAGNNLALERYGAGTSYLVRPDKIVAARWAHAHESDIKKGFSRAIAQGGS